MKLFDLDGTLIDSNGVWAQIDLDFLACRGLTHTKEYSDRVACSIFPIAAQFTKEYYSLSESPEEIMAQWLGMAQAEYAGQIPLKSGVRAFLEQERRKGETLVIVTACMPDLCRSALAQHGLTNFFQSTIFAQELGIEKCDPRSFSSIVKELDITPGECTLYEDAPENCAAAKAAGLNVVGVYDNFFAESAEKMKAVCDKYIESFTQLMDC